MCEVLLNRGDERRDAVEGAPTNAVARDLAKPPFDEIEPRTAGRDEMKLDAGMPAQPPEDGGLLCVLRLSRITGIASSAGVARSTLSRNRTNSRVSRLGRQVPNTVPSSRRKAAYKQVVPCRM